MTDDVTAIARRSNRWWAIEVPQIPGLFTQVRRLDQVETQVRAAAETLGIDVGAIRVEPELQVQEGDLLESVRAARSEAKSAQERSSKLTRQLIATLRDQGLTIRDIAAIAGISPQRVSAIQQN